MNRVKSDNKLRKDVSGYFLKILNISKRLKWRGVRWTATILKGWIQQLV